jgi:hypothetical protein
MRQEEFKVVTTSSNMNSFGLYGVIIMARTGEAFEIACSSLNKPDKGKMLQATLTDSGRLHDIKGVNYEIPKMLDKAPKDVVKEVFAS